MKPLATVPALMLLGVVGHAQAQCPPASVLTDHRISDAAKRQAYDCIQAEIAARAADDARRRQEAAASAEAGRRRDVQAAIEAEAERRRAEERAAANRAAAAKAANDRARADAAAALAAEQSPDNHCRDPAVAKKVLDAFNAIFRRRPSMEAVDVERLRPPVPADPNGPLACHGTFWLTNGEKVPGTIEFRFNAAREPFAVWSPDQGKPVVKRTSR